jgi:hypothetical protein
MYDVSISYIVEEATPGDFVARIALARFAQGTVGV